MLEIHALFGECEHPADIAAPLPFEPLLDGGARIGRVEAADDVHRRHAHLRAAIAQRLHERRDHRRIVLEDRLQAEQGLAARRGMVVARAGLTELRWLQQVAERLQKAYEH